LRRNYELRRFLSYELRLRKKNFNYDATLFRGSYPGNPILLKNKIP